MIMNKGVQYERADCFSMKGSVITNFSVIISSHYYLFTYLEQPLGIPRVA